VKWPNDILVGERKLAGILIQARTEGRDVLWIVAGFGINVHRPEGEIPEEISNGIAFGEDVCTDITTDRLADAIVAGLRGRLISLDRAAWKRAMEEWTGYASWNVIYTHRDGEGETRGTPVRLSEDGGLVLMTDRGEVTVYSGEVTEAVQSPESRVQR
jgi:BirA family biotin operon repressor/biotin-[acetyl-CoA-carboxylase] ligase